MCTFVCLQAHSDKSRDYTIPDTAMAMPQVATLPAATGWQQAAGMFVGSVGTQAPVPNGQMLAWDPSRPTYASVPGAYPGQAFIRSSVSQYPTSGSLPAAPPDSLPGSRQITHHGIQPRPAGGSPSIGQRPVYY